jgi:hypothetical protein
MMTSGVSRRARRERLPVRVDRQMRCGVGRGLGDGFAAASCEVARPPCAVDRVECDPEDANDPVGVRGAT